MCTHEAETIPPFRGRDKYGRERQIQDSHPRIAVRQKGNALARPTAVLS